MSDGYVPMCEQCKTPLRDCRGRMIIEDFRLADTAEEIADDQGCTVEAVVAVLNDPVALERWRWWW